MSTTGVNGTTGTTLTPTTTAGAPASGLGQNAFLQLMMDQLKNQDPLSPSDPTQYLSELAQFSSLEQQTSIAGSTATQATQSSVSSALALLGHSVSYISSGGVAATGTVSKVDFTTTSAPTLTVGGATGIALSSVTEAT